MALAVAFIAHLELQRRKYRRLWIEESKRHAHARTELAEMDCTAHMIGDCCATHVRTIARLKQEVAQLHEEVDTLRSLIPPSPNVGNIAIPFRALLEGTWPPFDGIKVEDMAQLHACECGAVATVEDGGQWYCAACYIPF